MFKYGQGFPARLITGFEKMVLLYKMKGYS